MHLVSRAKFATLAGVANPSIYSATKSGRPLSAALVGDRIDPDHPAALEYLAKDRTAGKRGTPGTKVATGSKAANERRKAAPAPTVSPPVDDMARLAADIRALADMPLRALVEVFGTDIRFLDWLKALKEIEGISEKRLKNAHLEGDLVTRELVRRGVFDPLDTAFRLLQTDGAKTIAVKSRAMAKAGESAEAIEKMVRGKLGAFIRPAKAKMTRGINRA